MSNYIEPAVIDSMPVTLKPILYTTYDTHVKYLLNITYEDSTTKQVELVQKDKNRPYKVVFKKEGKLITAIGVPTIKEVTECSKFCDFPNRILDSNDLLIELDCSETYSCTKVRFYLKDIRDIVDIASESEEDLDKLEEYNYHTKYPIYLNGFTCTTKIYCEVDEDSNILLKSQITKFGEPLSKDDYSEFTTFTVDFDLDDKFIEDEVTDNLLVHIPDELIGRELRLVIRYFVKEIQHPVLDEFIIIPIKPGENTEPEVTFTTSKAVTTQDTPYLGDGVLPALGTGLTPAYKQYKNKKSYTGSVFTDES